MILFLSKSFHLRLQLAWEPDLQAFLVGDRNLFFYIPEVIVEAPEISPEAIDAFLTRGAIRENWQLIGLLSPVEIPPMHGYALVQTHRNPDPFQWEAGVHLLSESPEYRKLEIKMSGD